MNIFRLWLFKSAHHHPYTAGTSGTSLVPSFDIACTQTPAVSVRKCDFSSSRSCFTYVRHPFISDHERQVRHTYIVVVGVRSLAAIDGSGSSFLMVSWVYGSASFRCGRSYGMFEVSISAVFALPRGEVLTGILL